MRGLEIWSDRPAREFFRRCWPDGCHNRAMQACAHGCFEIHLCGNLEKMRSLNAGRKEHRIDVSFCKRMDSCTQRSTIRRQGPLVNRHPSDVRASFSKALQEY